MAVNRFGKPFGFDQHRPHPRYQSFGTFSGGNGFKFREVYNAKLPELYKQGKFAFIDGRAAGESKETVVVNDEVECEQRLQMLEHTMGPSFAMVGVEVIVFPLHCYRWLCEFHPDFVEHGLSETVKNCLCKPQPSLLSLSSINGFSLIIQLCSFDSFPDCLLKFLLKEDLIKVYSQGCNPREMLRSWGVDTGKYVDLRVLLDLVNQKMGRDLFPLSMSILKDLPGTFFSSDVYPYDADQMTVQKYSFWANTPLTDEQKRVASFFSQVCVDMGAVVVECICYDGSQFDRNGKLGGTVGHVEYVRKKLQEAKVHEMSLNEKNPNADEAKIGKRYLNDLLFDIDADSDQERQEKKTERRERQLFYNYLEKNMQWMIVDDASTIKNSHTALRQVLADEGRLPKIVRQSAAFLKEEGVQEFDPDKDVPGFFTSVRAPLERALKEATPRENYKKRFLQLNLPAVHAQYRSEEPPGGHFVMHLDAYDKQDESDYFLEVERTHIVVRGRKPALTTAPTINSDKVPRLAPQPVILDEEEEDDRFQTGITERVNYWDKCQQYVYERCDSKDEDDNSGVSLEEITEREEGGEEDEESEEDQKVCNRQQFLTEVKRQMERDKLSWLDVSKPDQGLPIFQANYKAPEIEPKVTKDDLFKVFMQEMLKDDPAPSTDNAQVAQPELLENVYERVTLRPCWWCGEQRANALIYEPVVPESYRFEYVTRVECMCNWVKLCIKCVQMWRQMKLSIMVELAYIFDAPLDEPTHFADEECLKMEQLVVRLYNQLWSAAEGVTPKSPFESVSDYCKAWIRLENFLKNSVGGALNVNDVKMEMRCDWKAAQTDCKYKEALHWLQIVRQCIHSHAYKRNKNWHHEYKVFESMDRNPADLEELFRARFESVARSGKAAGRYLPNNWKKVHGCLLDRDSFEPVEEKPKPGESWKEMTTRVNKAKSEERARQAQLDIGDEQSNSDISGKASGSTPEPVVARSDNNSTYSTRNTGSFGASPPPPRSPPFVGIPVSPVPVVPAPPVVVMPAPSVPRAHRGGHPLVPGRGPVPLRAHTPAARATARKTRLPKPPQRLMMHDMEEKEPVVAIVQQPKEQPDSFVTPDGRRFLLGDKSK